MLRRGFTLIEVLIAVILVDVGLLALVGAGSILVRDSAERRVRTAATRAAADRLQLLGATPCVESSGSAASRDFRETWFATAPSNSVRELSDSVVFTMAGKVKIVVLRTRQSCA